MNIQFSDKNKKTYSKADCHFGSIVEHTDGSRYLVCSAGWLNISPENSEPIIRRYIDLAENGWTVLPSGTSFTYTSEHKGI